MDLLAKLKALYKECFADSDECAEYLFQTRLGIHNALFSQSNGVITSSLYLVDKKLDYCGKTVGLPFVVGLCTKKEFRNKGLARKLLKKAVKKCQAPFIMLYPQIFGFYEKMDFAVISYDDIIDQSKYVKKPCDNAWEMYELYLRYIENMDYYSVLDIKGFEELIKITELDGGRYYLLYDRNQNLAGFTNGEEGLSLVPENKKPGVMARIADLKQALSLLDEDIDIKIKLTDSLIEENNITFKYKGGQIIECADYDEVLSVSQLTRSLFGAGGKLKNIKGYIFERY